MENQKDIEISIKQFQDFGGKYKIRSYFAQDFVKDPHKIVLIMKQNGYIIESGEYYILTERGLNFKDLATDKKFADEIIAEKEKAVNDAKRKATLETIQIKNGKWSFWISILSLSISLIVAGFTIVKQCKSDQRQESVMIEDQQAKLKNNN